ncbi:hypothetical protein AAG570_000637 [Ranatra chinensis]|uniref:FGGY carbohydrate kinase domain-containing protein n=1 Tax=Ranatra chinensis TaxID=642074 RepID=A0ABD0ZAB6_9HEMI
MSESSTEFLIGVDVGTGSVRAALVDTTGVIRKISVQSIKMWSPKPDFFEQSSDDIWDACRKVIKEVKEGIPPNAIKGLGFDATCSLVVLDNKGKPVSVNLEGQTSQNVIMWLDHRASKQADFINSTEDPILKFVGGKVSLEMEVPKLLWLKENMKQKCWDVADKFFDLPDFLTWKATGCDSRSLCSLVCKWLYEVTPDGQHRWNKHFYQKIGLGELLDENARKIGSVVKAPGEPCGKGLSKEAAEDLGLIEGTAVATSIIDAHAGGIGLVGCDAFSITQDFTKRISLICGTSTCHMVVNKKAIFVNGVWGPYYSAMVPGFWLNEAGQSATGKLVDHIIDSHPASVVIKKKLFGGDTHVTDYLNNLLDEISTSKGIPFDQLTEDIHVWPDFHGNRSPIADPTLKGMICGLSLAVGEEHLALLYLATIQSLAYGTRHIIEVLMAEGYGDIECILACGGLSKNRMFVQTQANSVSKPVLIPQQVESVLLGSAVLAATCANIYPDVQSAVKKMAGSAEPVYPDLKVKR